MPTPALPSTLPVQPADALLPWTAFGALVHRLASRAGSTAPGGTLLIAVDGFSGAGKTWLATRLADALGATLLHVDAYVPGWHGLADGIEAIGRDLVRPWSRGRTGRAQSYDWDGERPGPLLTFPPPPLAVLEGCGIASLGAGSGLAARVWVHASPAARARRLDLREDHLDYLPHRTTWARQEEEIAARHDTPRRCDVRVRRAARAGVDLAPLPPRT
ncbi:MAG TPA: hypothetical protein VGC67_05035 [Cellulomonas sp.]